MLKQGYINQEQYDEAVAEELVFTNSSRDNSDTSDDYYSWFEDQVIRDVVSDLCDKTGYEYDIVYKMVMTGGYQIYSTVNPEVQAAVDAVYEDLQSLPATASSQQLQSGIVIVDNTTGDVVALAGGVGKAGEPCLELRHAEPALARLHHQARRGLRARHRAWPHHPGDCDGRYALFLHRLRDLAQEPRLDLPRSCVGGRGCGPVDQYRSGQARRADDAGIQLFLCAKDKMGLSTLVSSYQSNTGEELSDVNLWALALGSLTRGVTVRSMTAAYAAFANEGVWREARTYTVVKDANGQIILDNTQDSHVAMKDMTAWYITDMLETTVQTGTGTAAQLENMAVAGKTGTTSRDFDRWFAGYTPYYTSVVWCGYNDPEEIVLTDSETNPAIVMWKKVMEQVHQNLKNKAFKQPANLVEVTVCRDSGLLPSDACALDPRGERTVRVTLSAHDVPTETCNVHKEVEICNASGHVANEYCAQVPGNSHIRPRCSMFRVPSRKTASSCSTRPTPS